MSAPTVVRNPGAGQPVVKVALAFDWWRMAIAVAVGIGIYLIPAPEGLEGKPWGMLALFIATIVAVIAKAMPMGAVTLLALVIGGLIGLTPRNRRSGCCRASRTRPSGSSVSRCFSPAPSSRRGSASASPSSSSHVSARG